MKKVSVVMRQHDIWCVYVRSVWRGMPDCRLEKISWTDHVRNEEVLFRVKEQRNILHEISNTEG